jgi:DNA helicase-2/ATP-dependent DNA helicase PcrA
VSSKLLDDLNPAQRRALEHVNGAVLVLAGAGSGKTRVLTYRIVYLLEQRIVQPYEILAVTFTNKAANEMKHRVENLLQYSADGMWIGTFHSICARILRIEAGNFGYDRNFTIYDVDDQVRQIQQVMEALNIDQKIVKPRQVQYVISANKNKLCDPQRYEQIAANVVEKKISKIYWEYEAALRRNNAFDFDDLLIKPLDIFTKEPAVLNKYQSKFKYILVDEYQDTNKAQYYLIKQLSAKHHNICVVGDEDQSIYRWRGADIENILTFERDYPECAVIRLEQNYRSTQTILDAANSVVRHNTKRLGKNLWSLKKGGAKIQVIEAADEGAEAFEVANIIQQELMQANLSYKDIAILYRTNAQSRALEEKLRRGNIPYIIVGGTRFYDRKEVKDVLAYLRMLVNNRDSIALRRIINYPTRGIGLTTQQKLDKYAAVNQCSLYEALLDAEENDELPAATKDKILHFVNTLEEIRRKLDSATAYEIAHEVVNTFVIIQQYSLSKDPQDEARLENINELLNSIAQFTETRGNGGGEFPGDATLEKYLEDVSLLTDIDRWDPTFSAVTLMTLHSAKGLEFPVVIICGLEQGLFPLSRSLEKDDDLEEERRLFYVGMTRAKDSLYLLWAQQRRRFSGNSSGMSFRNAPSKFLKEIPHNYKDEESPSDLVYEYDYPNRRKAHYDDNFEDVSEYAAKMLEESEYKIGDWVMHEKFGKGQILGVEKSAAGTKLSVFFQGEGLKKLIAEYANLQFIK